jgi:hypothetical protein
MVLLTAPISFYLLKEMLKSVWNMFRNCSALLIPRTPANPECCGRSTQLSNSEDIRALGRVMQQLMEKGTEDGALGLERPDLWSEDAVDFLSMTLSASSQQLAEVSKGKNQRTVSLLTV